jgi:hypothetical protein
MNMPSFEMGRESGTRKSRVGSLITHPSSRQSSPGGRHLGTAANGSGVFRVPPTPVPPPHCSTHLKTTGLEPPAGGMRGGALGFETRQETPSRLQKFAHSLTRCTEISEGSVMDVAQGDGRGGVNARGREENRLAWCEYHQEQTERHRAVERHQDRCYHELQLRGG